MAAIKMRAIAAAAAAGGIAGAACATGMLGGYRSTNMVVAERAGDPFRYAVSVAAERVAPAVVNIVSLPAALPVTGPTAAASGSGVIVDSRGMVVTNAHVVGSRMGGGTSDVGDLQVRRERQGYYD